MNYNGTIHMCMRCGKFNVSGVWLTLKPSERPNDYAISHGYCPPCADIVRKEWGLKPKQKGNTP